MSVTVLNPGASMSMSQFRRTVQMRKRVVEACRLVEAGRNVRGVHIVGREQPTGEELRQYRDYASGCHVSLSVDPHGMISIRPRGEEDA